MKLAGRAALYAVTLGALSSPLAAQAADRKVEPEPPARAVWATLSLGLGYSSNRPQRRLLGAQLGAFGSYGAWVAGYRRGGASGIDSGGSYDDALLVGRRLTGMNSTTFIAVGPAKVYDESSGTGKIGIGFAAEAGENVRVLGLGLSTFGGFTPHLCYIGVGLTVDAGWIR